MDSTLLRTIEIYAKDPVFLSKLKCLVDAQTKALDEQQRRADYIARLVENQESPHGKRLVELLQRKSLYFGEREWVPDAFQVLENYGLVCCEYGPGAFNGLRTRTIMLTDAGREVAEKIVQITV